MTLKYVGVSVGLLVWPGLFVTMSSRRLPPIAFGEASMPPEGDGRSLATFPVPAVPKPGTLEAKRVALPE